MGLCLSQWPRLLQCNYLRPFGGYREYASKALKAFRKFQYNGKTYYTCNVDRLKECDRLGDKKQVSMWRTHFFLASPHFDDVYGAVFNVRPGVELAEATKLQRVPMFIAVGKKEMMCISRGFRYELETPLIFASVSVVVK